MKVFVTGASGFVGSAVTRNLLAHGHAVAGLARSDASAEKLSQVGASVVRGDLTDLDILTRAARDSDAVIHTAFIHDFASPDHDMVENCRKDLEALKALVEGIKGTQKPIVASNGVLGGRPGAEEYFKDIAKEGFRSITVRLSPTVHGPKDHGFIRVLIDGAKRTGFAIHVNDDAKWPAVHVEDAADLYRLAIEKDLPGGITLHGISELAIPTKAIANLISEETGVPVKKVSQAEAEQMYGFIGTCFASDIQASNDQTIQSTGWQPSHPDLLEDMKMNYFN